MQLIDVREPFETHIASIPGARLIPLGQLPAGWGSWTATRTGACSAAPGCAAPPPRGSCCAAGFTEVRNLKGGILAWADDVDPTLARY